MTPGLSEQWSSVVLYHLKLLKGTRLNSRKKLATQVQVEKNARIKDSAAD